MSQRIKKEWNDGFPFLDQKDMMNSWSFYGVWLGIWGVNANKK